MKNILFVCYGAGHVNMIMPLIFKALDDPEFKVTVLGLTTAGDVLHRNGIEFIGFKDLVEEGDQVALQYGQELALEMVSSNVSVSQEETVAYLGLSFNDLVIREGGVEQAKKEYNCKGRQAFLPITVMRRFFKRENFQILVSTNSPRAERAAFLVARELKIPSVCIVGLFARHEVEWICETDYGSRICVLSEEVKRFFLSAGRLEKEIEVTGNPALDRLACTSLPNRAAEFREKRGWDRKKVILWASQPEPKKHPFTGVEADSELPRKVDKALLKIIRRNPEWELVIRYHPGEMIKPVDWPDDTYISTADDDLAVLLKSVDVVVTMTSTVGVEGVLLGKPLIAINQSVFCDDAPYARMGLARGVADINNLDDLELAFHEVLTGKWQPKEKLPKVGAAASSVYKIIKELTS